MSKNPYTPEQLQSAAESLGFQNADLMLAHFRVRLLKEGFYEALLKQSEAQNAQGSPMYVGTITVRPVTDEDATGILGKPTGYLKVEKL